MNASDVKHKITVISVNICILRKTNQIIVNSPSFLSFKRLVWVFLLCRWSLFSDLRSSSVVLLAGCPPASRRPRVEGCAWGSGWTAARSWGCAGIDLPLTVSLVQIPLWGISAAGGSASQDSARSWGAAASGEGLRCCRPSPSAGSWAKAPSSAGPPSRMSSSSAACSAAGPRPLPAGSPPLNCLYNPQKTLGLADRRGAQPGPGWEWKAARAMNSSPRALWHCKEVSAPQMCCGTESNRPWRSPPPGTSPAGSDGPIKPRLRCMTSVPGMSCLQERDKWGIISIMGVQTKQLLADKEGRERASFCLIIFFLLPLLLARAPSCLLPLQSTASI